MAKPLYKPPIGITTIQIPYLSLVTKSDPGWTRQKFREIVYEFAGKIFIENPYVQGPYATPTKLSIINYVGPATFNPGDITGVGFDFVKVNSTNANPGVLTTRTAAQMFGDITNASLPLQYYLRINNIGGGGVLTLGAGAGVTLQGVMTMTQNTYSDFVVSFIDTSHLIITTQTYNNLFQSVSH